VKVEERIDFRRNEATVVRLDTNETVRYRALTPDERQPALFDAPGEPLTATVEEVATAKRGRKGKAETAPSLIAPDRCPKEIKGVRCVRDAGHRGAHAVKDSDGLMSV